MALIDRWDRRALLLASLPAGLFLVLFVRCTLPPGLGVRATMPFAGVMLLSYGPLFYLALFRAWGDMEYSRPFGPKAKTAARGWTALTGSFWSPIGGHWLLGGASLWVARLHWSLVSNAKDELAEAMPGSLEHMLEHLYSGEPPTGLDLFGPTLLIVGIIIPLVIVGLLWLLLPSRP